MVAGLQREADSVENYLFHNRITLQSLVDFCWEKQEAKGYMERAALSAWETVEAGTHLHSCECGGRWVALTEDGPPDVCFARASLRTMAHPVSRQKPVNQVQTYVIYSTARARVQT